jgi:hypothetical protein
VSTRLAVGATDLPLDEATIRRFLANCAHARRLLEISEFSFN